MTVVYDGYGAKHQLAKETQRDSEGQDLYAWEWDYDPAGNRTEETSNGTTTYYSYNEANELTEETTDGVTTYYSYDRCGNTTSKQELDEMTYYHYDHENLLRQIDLPDGAHNYFTYDADSKRVSKQDSDGFTEFIYQGPDMLRLLLERDDQAVTQAHYTMGNGLESMRREAESSFYHFDALGSTFELTDAVEDVSDTYLYNAWGQILGTTGDTLNRHTFVGRERYSMSRNSAYALLGLRYYVPKVGRFWTVDLVRDGLNWYVFVLNRPTVLLDPTGGKATSEKILWYAKLKAKQEWPCYGPWETYPHSYQCTDLWLDAAKYADPDAIKDMRRIYYRHQPDFDPCRRSYPRRGTFENHPGLANFTFYRRICNWAVYLSKKGTWDWRCKVPKPGMLVTTGGDPESNRRNKYGTHSGIIADVQGGRVACVIACSERMGNKVVYTSVAALDHFRPGQITGCGELPPAGPGPGEFPGGAAGPSEFPEG